MHVILLLLSFSGNGKRGGRGKATQGGFGIHINSGVKLDLVSIKTNLFIKKEPVVAGRLETIRS